MINSIFDSNKSFYHKKFKNQRFYLSEIFKYCELKVKKPEKHDKRGMNVQKSELKEFRVISQL